MDSPGSFASALAADATPVGQPLAVLFRKQPTEVVVRCSFCNKSQRDVAKLIAGPSVYICVDCVDICNQIVAEDKVLESGEKTDSEAVPAVRGDVEAPVRCSMCQMVWPRDQSVAFPDRGWLCAACLDVVRSHLDSSKEVILARSLARSAKRRHRTGLERDG